MRQLSSVDAQFLAIEDRRMHGHVCALSLLDPGLAPSGGELTLETLGALVEARLEILPPLRQRVVKVPGRIAHPYWIDDPDVDLEFHLRELRLPSPGDERQLAERVTSIHSQPLDRSRPLWELYLIHGLERGRLALLAKVHHAAVDGVHGLELLRTLLDPPSDGRDGHLPTVTLARRAPSPAELFVRGLHGLPGQPLRALRAFPHVVRNLDQIPTTRALPGAYALSSLARRATRSALPSGRAGVFAGPPGRAPRTVFNGRISPEQSFACGRLSLDEVTRIKSEFRTTVNDVVVALVAASVRAWLTRRDALPAEPLLAMIPVSVRGTDGNAENGNRVSTMIVSIPTHESDPLGRLELAHEALVSAKERHRTLPSRLLEDANEFIPPLLLGRISRLIAGMAARDSRPPPCNLVISNVAGPQSPLYCSGAKLRAIYPVSAILDGVGLNVSVLSYCGNLDFGIVADRAQVPDPWRLIDGLHTALRELSELAPRRPKRSATAQVRERRARERAR